MSKKRSVARKSEIQTGRAKNAFYCSLRVEAVQIMEHCSLIRYRKRKFIVDTADLVQQDKTDLTRLHHARRAA